MELKEKRAIILTIVAILILILIFLIISLLMINKDKNRYNVDVSTGYTSIEQVVESNDCKYIKDFVKENDEYPINIELEFKYDLYNDEESNETFYTKIIDEIVKFVGYTNVRMLDEEKDITIEVSCKNGKIDIIKINGIEDYFIYMDSQISVSKYEEIKTSNIEPTSDVLRNLIDINWDSSINCGSRESIFNNYYIFFDEGIEYRKIGSKIYNVIFTKNYHGEVVSNVFPGESNTSVKLKLGEPAFENKDLDIIGYKCANFYVFFTGNEISIYRNVKTDYSDFWKLVEKFVDENSSMSFKEFMNELTYIWPDYSDYTYDSNYMFISYPIKGVDVKLNDNGESGIVVYNNISENLNKVKKYLENSELLSKLQLDNVFEAEKRRIEKYNNLKDKCNEFEKSSEENDELHYVKSSLYDFYIEYDERGFAVTTYFISKTGNEINRELNEPINSYLWINDNYFVYSIKGKGIYSYDVINGNKQVLTEGSDNYLIRKFEDNIIYYDNTEISIYF